jgi:hypothetical protein
MRGCLEDQQTFFGDADSQILARGKASGAHGFLRKSRTTTGVEADLPDLRNINGL